MIKLLDNIYIKILYKIIVPILIFPALIIENEILIIILCILLIPLLIMALVGIVYMLVEFFIDNF
jgi:hypothetical protein